MTTSGSYNFALTRDDLVNLAHQHVGLLGEGETCTSSQLSEAANLLNMIVKLRAADGMPLWALKRGYILPFSDASSINTVSHVVSTYDTTTLSADAVSGATSITITAAGNTANSDQIGVEQDDGSILWTTISSGGGTTSITLASALTDDASSGNRVYYYTASADRIPARPERILEANVLQVSDSSSWTIDILTREDYYSLGNRTIEGTPSGIYYDATLGSATADPTSASNWYGTIYVYPRFANGDNIIEFTYQRPFQDFDSAADNIDFPQAFYLPIMLELAALLGPKAGLPIEERRALFAEAKMYRDEALSTVAPEGSMYIGPERD
jgi:hypothetical protein